MPGRGDTVGVPGKMTRVPAVAATMPLAAPVRAKLEGALASDLSAVRVGEDASVAAMGARAYARGVEIWFAPGAYQPETPDGQALIAHEVVHLVQQAAGRVAPSGDLDGTPVNTDAGLEREADAVAGRALRGEAVGTSGTRLAASEGPVQGFFENLPSLGDLVDPIIDAASGLWDAIAGGAGSATKGKGKGGGKKPGTGPEDPAAPELPTTDEDWQQLIAESRAAVQVTENYAVTTRVLNPDLLFAVRTSHLENLDEFYHVLTKKSDLHKAADANDFTPGGIAYHLGTELQAQAAATTAAPILLASKLALLDKAAVGGAIDISKSSGGNLRVALGKDLSKPAQATISEWIKSRYTGSRLKLTAVQVGELRAVVTDAVTATTSDPDRDARIEKLRAGAVACEARVRALLRTKASDTSNAKRKALWTQLADRADSDGVLVDRTLSRFTIEAEDGTTTTLESVNAISVNLLNPAGFKAGGGAYSSKTIDSVLDEVYAGDAEKADKSDATKRFIRTLNRNEGGPGSMNTWDGEIVSAGPGLSGSGRLQKSMFEYKAADPGGFHDALGKFGVDIKRNSAKSNPYFTVRVPGDVTAIPVAMREVVSPGQIIVGSDSTGASKGSDKYEECAALRYISKDPVLLSRFMYAGQHSYERFLVKEAVASMHKAESFSFLVGEARIQWHDVIEPLGKDWLAATQAVIAYRYHASSSTYEDLKVKAAQFYSATFGADRAVDALGDGDRKAIGRYVAGQLKHGKYVVYREQFPTIAAEVFPPETAKEKKAREKKEEKARKKAEAAAKKKAKDGRDKPGDKPGDTPDADVDGEPDADPDIDASDDDDGTP
jgi:Domain of unknown function (DUF4157)